MPSNSKVASLADLALWMVRICWAMTDSTSRSMRLNSSKQAQAPADAKPLKNLPCSHKGFAVNTFYICLAWRCSMAVLIAK